MNPWGLSLLVLLELFGDIARDLQVAEVFSGVGAVVGAASSKGLAAAAFDINRIPGLTDDKSSPGCEDLTGTSSSTKGRHSNMLLLEFSAKE
jgi:hypothetical protein